MTDTLIERLGNLETEGKQVEGTSDKIDINVKPDYFDEKRFRRAQLICQKYYTNLSTSSMSGLILLLQLDFIAIPLLKSGRSRTVADLNERYIATAKFVRSFYESDFYDSESEGWKYINLVRAMHKRAYKMMNEDHKFKLEHPNVWVNQYDMALTQFAFVGLFLLRPDKCAAYHVSTEELADITYYWRIISYYFGIEERFNLFVHHDDINKQVDYMRIVLDHMKSILDDRRYGPGLKMSRGILLAFEDFTTETTFNILDHWWSPFVSMSGDAQLAPYSFFELWKLFLFQLYFSVLFRSNLMMKFLNEMYKKKFDKFCESAEKTRAKLNKKYADFICELQA